MAPNVVIAIFFFGLFLSQRVGKEYWEQTVKMCCKHSTEAESDTREPVVAECDVVVKAELACLVVDKTSREVDQNII